MAGLGLAGMAGKPQGSLLGKNNTNAITNPIAAVTMPMRQSLEDFPVLAFALLSFLFLLAFLLMLSLHVNVADPG